MLLPIQVVFVTRLKGHDMGLGRCCRSGGVKNGFLEMPQREIFPTELLQGVAE